MQNKGTKIITVLAVVVGVAAIFYFLAFYPFRMRSAAQISFCYTTNDPARGFIGVLAVTNFSNDNLRFEPMLAQVLVHGVWSNPRFASKGIPQLTVSPYGTNSFFVSIPTNCEAWRAPIAWGYQNLSTMELWRGKVEANIKFNWQQLMNGQRPQYFNASVGTLFLACSETITNK